MSTAISVLAPVRFSTRDYPERDRQTAWREAFGRRILNVDIEASADVPFFHEATLWNLPGGALIKGSCCPVWARRTRELMTDGNDDLLFNVNTRGHMEVSQLGRDAVFAPGEGVLISSSDISVVHSPVAIDFVCLRVPRSRLASHIADIDAALVRRLPGSADAIRLFVDYVDTLSRGPVPASLELQRLVVMHLQDLEVLALGPTRDAAAMSDHRGLRAARLRSIKSDIVENLGRQDLSIAAVAARQGVSPRYIHMLFETEGVTFSEFVLDKRLASAHRMLINALHHDWRVSAIAFAVGFGDLSHFNRSFRRRYGAAPSDVRAAARREG